MLWCRAVMERWLEVGWGGSPPYFIAHSDAYHTIPTPAHLFFCFFPSVSQCDTWFMECLAKYGGSRERECRCEHRGFRKLQSLCMSTQQRPLSVWMRDERREHPTLLKRRLPTGRLGQRDIVL